MFEITKNTGWDIESRTWTWTWTWEARTWTWTRTVRTWLQVWSWRHSLIYCGFMFKHSVMTSTSLHCVIRQSHYTWQLCYSITSKPALTRWQPCFQKQQSFWRATSAHSTTPHLSRELLKLCHYPTNVWRKHSRPDIRVWPELRYGEGCYVDDQKQS